MLNYCYISLLGCCLLLTFSSQAETPHARPARLVQPADPGPVDSIPYRGYRLDLISFEVIKRTDDWIKMKFTAVNSGRMDVDFSNDGTAHWVQVNFDRSVFGQKIGGFRNHIRQTLINEKYTLEIGKKEEVVLKVPVILPVLKEQPGPGPGAEAPLVEDRAHSNGVREEIERSDNVVEIDMSADKKCPDLLFTELSIISQDDKWATLYYAVKNEGEGDFFVYGIRDGREDNLVIRAFISGVTTLSRGALPIGGQFVEESSGRPQVLKKGDTLSGQLRIDVRKKTRYMKSLILSLDSNQFAQECDRTNNTAAVILE